MGVGDRVRAIEAQSVLQYQRQMAPRLADFLDVVWAERANPNRDIYALYVGGRPHAPVDADRHLVLSEADETLVTDFTAALGQIGVANGVTRFSQWWGWAAADGFLEDPALFAQAAVQKGYDFVVHDIGCSFFHFRTGESPARRVYLNVLPAYRAAVQRHIVENVVCVVDDVTNSKVLGPLGMGHDTIVVYARTQIAVDQVLRSAATYQATAGQRAHFGIQGIQIARPVNRFEDQLLTGVFVAVEPSDELKVEFESGSFGAVWDALLERCLASAPGGQAVFLQTALNEMKRFDIDPMRPEI